MPLVDDLIEPFRPFVDMEVHNMFFKDGTFELDTENKKRLVGLLDRSVMAEGIKTSPNQIMHKIASSLGRVYENKQEVLYLPEMKWVKSSKKR
jgi:CRISPR-associated protein Cas1